ncbi:MAG: 4-amino-4-deoxy-L-arabinose-phospho-UDP flippase [Verrucomicrobiaceae bacterium]|nr:4-amino-4-deoxy-L-arabinose-phospho-UDP flippase [Verrucomicrobiaceae bacterium]
MSTHNAKAGLLFVSISVVLVSIAQLLLKIGATNAVVLPEFTALLDAITANNLLTIGLPIALGLLFYLASMFVWLRALGELPLSIAYPLLSLSYPLVYIAALVLPVFHETLSTTRVVGLLFTIAGIALLAPRATKTP